MGALVKAQLRNKIQAIKSTQLVPLSESLCCLDFGHQFAVCLKQTYPIKGVFQFQHFTDVFDRHITDTDTILLSYALLDHADIDFVCQKSLLIICR